MEERRGSGTGRPGLTEGTENPVDAIPQAKHGEP